MRQTQETRAGLWALLLLQLGTSMTAIVLLGRMGPAIERIIDDNVYSTLAVEDMLAALAHGQAHDAFLDAYGRARSNVTEADEVPLLDTIERWDQAALEGDPAAQAEILEALQGLAEVNRRSIIRADQAASRLSLAGAWAMAILGLVGFLVSMGVWRRIDLRVLQPLQEVATVVGAVRRGDRHRRCLAPIEGTSGGLAHDVNWLLDHRAAPVPAPADDPTVRRALIAVLDHCIDTPVVVGTSDGAVVTANAAALAASVPTRSLARSVARDEAVEGWTVEPLGTDLWLARQQVGSA